MGRCALARRRQIIDIFEGTVQIQQLVISARSRESRGLSHLTCGPCSYVAAKSPGVF
jgi:hypothetical protein